MSVFALTSVTTVVDSNDFTDHLKSATLTAEAAQLDSTDFDSGGWTEVIGGLKGGSLQLNFNDDVANASIDDLLWAMLGTVVTFSVKPSSASVGTSNPSYSGSVLITSHSLGGSVGDLAEKSLTFPTSGAISRAES